jgi:hypothetical protein
MLKLLSLFGRVFVAVALETRSRKVNIDNGRVFTAKEVLNDRSDFLVIGMPTIKSLNPLKSFNQAHDGIEL